MTLEQRFPIIFSQPLARQWLLEQESDLASNTVSAYGHALVDYFRFCAIRAINPTDAKRTDVRAYVTELKSRSKSGIPARRPGYGRSTGHQGFANATVRLRVATVRLYYEYLIDEEVRTTNPITLVKYKKGRGGGGNGRGMVDRYEKDPWLPNETQWQTLLNAASSECIRNRFMLALAYDTGVRRAELCALETGDVDPSQRLLHLRAKTTKSQRARQVPYSQATGELYAAYLQHRRRISQAPGPLFLSESRRNKGESISFWTWSKVVKALGERAGLPLFTPHTLRHLRLTDLAQAGWKMVEVAAFAGHVHPAMTMTYVHISGLDLNERFRQTLDSTLDWRQKTMQTSLQ